MRTIKIISGGYGLHIGRRIELKDSSSAPFSVEDAEADRLVSAGVAEYTETAVATPEIHGEKEQTGVNTSAKKTAVKGKKEQKKSTSGKKTKEDKSDDVLVLNAADPV